MFTNQAKRRLGAWVISLAVLSALLLPATSEAASAAQKTDAKIKVELWTQQNKPLKLDIKQIDFLNFASTAMIIDRSTIEKAPEQMKFSEADLPSLCFSPESDNLKLSGTSETAKNLRSNEFYFRAAKPEAWLLNLQLKNYTLKKVRYDETDKVLKLYYEGSQSLQAPSAYFTGLLNSESSREKNTFANVTKKIKELNHKQKLNGDVKRIVDLIEGVTYDANDKLPASAALWAAENPKKDLNYGFYTLSYTMIKDGKSNNNDNDLFVLPVLQKNLPDVYTGKLSTRKDSDRSSAKKDKQSSTKAGAQAGVSEQKSSDEKSAAPSIERKQSKYRSKVVASNDTSVVQSTGETAASISLSLVCFIAATCVYAIKRRYKC